MTKVLALPVGPLQVTGSGPGFVVKARGKL